MIRVRQVKVLLEEKEKLIKFVAKKLNINEKDITYLKIIKESLDARKKPVLYLVYEVDIEVLKEKEILKRNKSLDVFMSPKEEFSFLVTGQEKIKKSPVIVGSGPSGLFCAYFLAEAGFKPIVLERGEKIEDRVKTVTEFWENSFLNENSNVQFGEGGAGTFSDGKLNTLVKDKGFIGKKVFEIFVENGAPKEIMYLNKPHIGTDVLRKVIINLRNKIISMGGSFLYNSCVTDISISDGKVDGVIINEKEKLNCDILVLAIGHSSRDTIEMLYKHNLLMQSKPFAIGLRIVHPAKMINLSQYGKENVEYLKNASYKLTYKAKNRGVYSFCMCPGGYVVNSSSEKNHLVVNGMSNYNRDSKTSNSAIVVTVSNKDYGDGLFDGVNFQRELEKKAYLIGNGNIPCQLYKDFKNDVVSSSFGSFKPDILGKYTFANLNLLFSKELSSAIKESIDYFNNSIKGFNKDDSVLLGIESRTSSPIRILRNEEGVSNILGIYPSGEGAGYSGGITTSAIDGVKVAQKIAQKYKV